MIPAMLLVLLVTLSSCSATWHLKRALVKDPSLRDSITTVIEKPVEIIVPGISDSTSVTTVLDTTAMDSIVQYQLAELCSEPTEKKIRNLRNDIRKQLIHDLENDTVSIDTAGLFAFAYYRGLEHHLKLMRLPDTIRDTVKIPCKCPPQIQPVIKKNGDWYWFIILGAAIIIILQLVWARIKL